MWERKEVTWSIEPLSGYRSRVVDNELDDLLPGLPAIVLEGAKGVGKTATARQRSSSSHYLDDEQQHEVARADVRRLLTTTEPILIDEWQRLPSTWDAVRRAVDEDPRPGRFLLTGSASPRTAPTHSGAGRMVHLRMRPLSLSERGMKSSTSIAELLKGEHPDVTGSTDVALEDYVAEILAGGFPALRGLTERALRAQLDSYLARIVDRDFPEMGQQVRRPDTLQRWMAAYASATSGTATYEAIRDAATGGQGNKPARTTTEPYRDVLERLWVVDPVPAWTPGLNHMRRLGAAPKHQFVDPALAARLLGAGADALLDGASTGPDVPRDGTLLGALFESLVCLNLRVYAQACEAKVRHLRTKGGDHEVDYILVRDDSRVLAVEVKLSATVDTSDVRHLLWLKDQLGDQLLDAVIVTTGRDAYRRPDGIAVVPAALLGP